MINLLFEYIRCKPEQVCAKCCNCKRLSFHPLQTKGGVVVNVKNSKSKACVYMPISLQEDL
jgi:hypothetical protein